MTLPRVPAIANLTACPLLLALISVGLSGCSAAGEMPLPTAPSAVLGAPPMSLDATSSATATGANLAADSAFAPANPTLASTCPGSVSRNGSVTWPRFTECVVITPTGSSYALTNDPYLQVTTKRGVITHVTLYIDDIVGEEGIQHETDPIPVTPQVAYGGAGFVLHVHADRVPVYRLSGHIGGRRVAMIGTISIADVSYF
jgi:hypothetical protein